MSYANAIIGLGVGIAAVILIIAIACYVIFSYAHMKALKALGYDKAWLAWIPYGCTFACADAAAKDEDPVELFGSFTVPALLFKLWWILLLVLGFLPFPGWLSNVLNIALNIVFMGSIYAKMFAELDGKTESEEQVLGCVSGFLPDRCSIQILMHEINHYQMKGAVVRCDYGSSFFLFYFFRTQKIPGRTTWNLCVEMYITTKGIEKSKTKKKTVPGFGAIS